MNEDREILAAEYVLGTLHADERTLFASVLAQDPEAQAAVAAWEARLAALGAAVEEVPPPPEVWRGFNNQQQAEIAKLFLAPKAMHKIRLTNTGKTPITTAPALIMLDNKILAQSMTTYTPGGMMVEKCLME